MKDNYRTVRDLSTAELDELREAYFDQPDSDDIFESVENITDNILFEHYEGILFVDDDFFCNQKGYYQSDIS